MFKRILAAVAAVLLGAGLSVVAVAAPASAHTPDVGINCGSVTYQFTSYGGGSTNVFKLYVDDMSTPVVTETFGDSLSQKTYTFDGATSHSVKYTIDASDQGTTYDVTSPVQVTTPCTYPTKSLDTTCDAVTINWGGKLDNSIHLHVKVQVGGTSKQVHAEFDYNIPGGYGPNQLGVRFKDWNGVQTVKPLTEQQVKSGRFTFEFPAYLPGGTTSYVVQWVQFNELHFNQDENPATWIFCGSSDVAVSTEPSVTPPTCDADGTLVVPAQTGILWSGGTNGAGPGTYTLVASAAAGYTLTKPYSKTLTVLPATGDCVIPVSVKGAPSVTPPSCLAAGTLVLPAQTGIVWSGGTNGAGPGSYTITASAAEGYTLTEPYSIQLTVLPADASLCAMDPKADVQPGTCVPVGDISRKPVLFTFDNRDSQLPVTFTIPSIDGFAPVVVPAGAVSDPIPGPNVDHLTGGSWEVFADGDLLTTLTVDPFEQCQDELTPGDPSSAPEECVAGEVTSGSITIVPSPGKIAYTITGGPTDVTISVSDDAPKTELPAGDYVVTAHGINGFKVGPDNTWTHPISVLEPAGCERIAIPVSTMSTMECAIRNGNVTTVGGYTLPATEYVDWFVNGSLTTSPSDVFVPGAVVVEARISQAGKDAGVFFTDGTQSKTVTHTFVLPAEDCTTTLPLLYPTAAQQDGTCTALPTFMVSNTTSEHGGVQWQLKEGDSFVTITPGVHTADWGSTEVVTATLVDPVHDGFAPEQKTEWSFTFPGKPACGDLTTLALTGTAGGPVLWIAGALLLLGGAGIYFARRRLAAAK